MQKLIENHRKQSMRRCLTVLGLLLVLACIQGRAQSTQGSIVGSVTDKAGAVVPGAAVTLTNTDEGTVRTTKSNGVGDFHFQDVKAGRYSVEVSAPSFEKWAVSGVTLEVRQDLRLDAKLSVGTVQQEVQMTPTAFPSIRAPASAAPAPRASSAHCLGCKRTATAPASPCKERCLTRWM